MRFIDKYVGYFLCFFTSLAYLLKPKRYLSKPKKILITKFWGIGSIILTTPTIKSIRKKFPKAKITFLTLEANKGLYEDSELFDETLYLKLNKVSNIFLNFFRLVFQLRKRRFDLAFDLDIFPMFSMFLLSISGIKYKIGHRIGKTGEKILYDKTAVYNNKQHISDSFFDLARLIGIEDKPDIEEIPVSKEDESFIQELLKSKGILKNHKIIGINVNASDFGTARRWPIKNFAKVADEIIKKDKVKVVFIGAKSDKKRVKDTIKLMKEKGAIDLSGRTNLKQLAYLIKKFDLFITNDSGPMHIAVAMKTPVIAFFGPETPLIYGPLGEKHTVFYKRLYCSPCLSVYNSKRIVCKNNEECVKSIKPEEVISAVEKYIK